MIEREIVFFDTAYYGQAHRKLALIGPRYKYIFNKYSNSEELYDLIFDTNETVNLLNHYVVDEDRYVIAPVKELYFYPYWNDIPEVVSTFRKEFLKVWKNTDKKSEIKKHFRCSFKINVLCKKLYRQIKELNRI